MKKYGYTGVLYLPYDYIGTKGYLSVTEVKEMSAAGWEVGSHTLSHPINFMTLDAPSLRAEIVDSRKKLEALLGLPILTFAYPFGDAPNDAVDYVHFAGYIAAMGATGFKPDQGPGNLFVLQRCEIAGWEDAKTMIRFLPWQGDPSFLPPDTPTATLRPDLVTLTIPQMRTSVWWIDTTHRDAGARAIARSLLATSSPWRLVGHAMLSAPLSWIADPVYRVVARHRHRFPGSTEACRVDDAP